VEFSKQLFAITSTFTEGAGRGATSERSYFEPGGVAEKPRKVFGDSDMRLHDV